MNFTDDVRIEILEGKIADLVKKYKPSNEEYTMTADAIIMELITYYEQNLNELNQNAPNTPNTINDSNERVKVIAAMISEVPKCTNAIDGYGILTPFCAKTFNFIDRYYEKMARLTVENIEREKVRQRTNNHGFMNATFKFE